MTETARRKIEYVDIDSVVPAERNPKRHDIDGVRRSMATLGYIDPVLHDERTGRLVGGHGRIEALQAMRDAGEPPPDGVVTAGGVWKVPMVRGWASADDRAADAAVVALNRYVELGGWDNQGLVDVLRALDPDLAKVAGYDHGDGLAALLGTLAPAPPVLLADPDDVPPLPKTPRAKRGQVWELGRHRLMCGDSTNRADIATLMAGEQADMMLTDPPYGVAFGGDKGKNAISGDLTQAAIPVSFAMAMEVLSEDARIYLFGGTGNWSMYSGLFDAHLRMQVRPIVWVKNGFVMRPNNYHSAYEMVYFGWRGRGGSSAWWFGDRRQTDVWQVARDAPGDKVHPTQKPVEVCAIPIRNSCPPDGLIYEPFGGSGSTLIAAHTTGRRANVMELDPKYADVIARRWADLTGGTPKLLDG